MNEDAGDDSGVACHAEETTMADREYLQLECPQCHATAVCGPEDQLARLQRAGMLRREKEPAGALVRELFAAAAPRFPCWQCGHVGLILGPVPDDFADAAWGPGRRCAECGQPIDRERLELLPDTRLCVACQRAAETPVGKELEEYCPRCGSRMVLQRRRGGIAAYVLVCPACGN